MRFSDTTFAALAALTRPSDYPDTPDVSSGDFIGHVVFSLPPNGESALNQCIVWAPVQLFEGGWYALVFGSNLFGASGFGVMLPGTSAPSDTFFKTETGTAYHEYTQPYGYLGVLGHTGPPFEVSVPEPSTLLLASGLAGLGVVAWRRHRTG
jgi:hypothetical protein